jgi:conjugal transfer pilus assembly protein TrbC
MFSSNLFAYCEQNHNKKDVVTQDVGFTSQSSGFKVLVDKSIAASKENQEQEKYQELVDIANQVQSSNAKRLKARLEQDKSKVEEQGMLSQILKNWNLDQNEPNQNNINNKNKDLSQDTKNSQRNALVFVSFSMPDELLWSYMNQAKQYGAKLIIRGLVNNSFKETMKAMDLGDNKILKLEVNPKLFKEHNITLVPAIVLLNGNNKVSGKFTGSVSLSYCFAFSKGQRGV